MWNQYMLCSDKLCRLLMSCSVNVISLVGFPDGNRVHIWNIMWVSSIFDLHYSLASLSTSGDFTLPECKLAQKFLMACILIFCTLFEYVKPLNNLLFFSYVEFTSQIWTFTQPNISQYRFLFLSLFYFIIFLIFFYFFWAGGGGLVGFLCLFVMYF